MAGSRALPGWTAEAAVPTWDDAQTGGPRWLKPGHSTSRRARSPIGSGVIVCWIATEVRGKAVAVCDRAAFAWISESKVGEDEPFMLRFERVPVFLHRLTGRSLRARSATRRKVAGAGLAFLCFFVWSSLSPRAYGQADFTLQASTFNHFAIDPGGTAFLTLTLGPLNGFNGIVNLTCGVTPASSASPGCVVSKAQVTPPASASLVVNGTNPTSGLSAAPGTYTISVTGTGYNGTTHSLSATITVQAVAPAFTITVGTAVVPSGVHAGSGGQATISVNPLNGYVSPGGTGQGVWLSCATVTPLVTIPPVCSFNPQPVVVTGTATSVTLTISTTGPVTSGNGERPRLFYGLLLPLPLLALLGAVTDKRSRKAWGLAAVVVLSGVFLLTPACGNSLTTTTPTSTASGITPKDGYTFTLIGVDSNGTVSTNTGTNSSAPSVSLTVN